jgi:hypothetical protein
MENAGQLAHSSKGIKAKHSSWGHIKYIQNMLPALMMMFLQAASRLGVA